MRTQSKRSNARPARAWAERLLMLCCFVWAFAVSVLKITDVTLFARLLGVLALELVCVNLPLACLLALVPCCLRAVV